MPFFFRVITLDDTLAVGPSAILTPCAEEQRAWVAKLEPCWDPTRSEQRGSYRHILPQRIAFPLKERSSSMYREYPTKDVASRNYLPTSRQEIPDQKHWFVALRSLHCNSLRKHQKDIWHRGPRAGYEVILNHDGFLGAVLLSAN